MASALLVLAAPAAAQQAPEPPLVITTAPPQKELVDAAPTAEQRTALLQRLADARKALAALTQQSAALSSVTRYALTAELQRLQHLLDRRRPSCNPAREVARLERDLALAAAGESPHLKPGLHRLAYRSPLDRELHAFAVYVPPGYSATGPRLPLVVMLHGMRSDPMRAMGRLFGVDDDKLGEDRIVCDRPQLGRQNVLVVAPGGFGDSLYRLAGERDVGTVVGMMAKLYRVDRRRITITGLSMGGTGAAEIALQYPQRYAGVVALCGYYDRRLDSRVRGKKQQPWERYLNRVHSPVDWAANGRGIPLVLIHGRRDGPERARAMEARYRKLGYPVTLELYDRGHDVWGPGYADGRAFALLKKFRKEPAPSHVTFVSGRSRVRRGYWVLLEAWQDYSRWARVDARIVDRKRVEVQTENVGALRLDLPAFRLAPRATVKLSIDGSRIDIPPQGNRWVRRVRLQRDVGGWTLQARPRAPRGLIKRPGLAGPIEDIYFDPIVVVYGTDGGQAAALRKLAKKIAGYSRRVDLSYSLVADRRFRPRMARRSSVILVGNEQTNRVLRRLGPRLPIRVLGDRVLMGGRSLTGPNIGTTYIYPNPESPRWYVLVVGGTTPESYKLWRKLPGLLPDFVVFDDSVATRRWQMLLGNDRSLVRAGYFDGRWQLPSEH